MSAVVQLPDGVDPAELIAFFGLDPLEDCYVSGQTIVVRKAGVTQKVADAKMATYQPGAGAAALADYRSVAQDRQLAQDPVFRAVVSAMLDEINELRSAAGMMEVAQTTFVSRIKVKLNA